MALKTNELQALTTLTGAVGLSTVADKLNKKLDYDAIKESRTSQSSAVADDALAISSRGMSSDSRSLAGRSDES